jgi:hypothetical protein
MRLLASQDWLMAELLQIAKSSKNDSVKLKAIRDALDRAGLSARHEVHVEAQVSVWDQMFDDVVVLPDTNREAEDPEIAALNKEAMVPEPIEPTPLRRALPAAKNPDEPLEGVVLDKPEPARIPPRIVEGLRASGIDI